MTTGIEIVETEEEYLLRIPPSQKERAKDIEGRQWDRERRAWVYPRTNKIHRSLIAEFGDDARIEITPPDLEVAPRKPADMKAENAALSTQLEETNSKMDRMEGLIKKLGDVKSSGGKETEKIAALQFTLSEKETRISEQKGEISKLDDEIQRIKEDNKRLSQKITEQAEQDHDETLENSVKNLLMAIPGNNKFFEDELRKHGVSERFVTESQKGLNKYLRNLLGETDRQTILAQLIGQAKEEELLSREESYLAHTARSHRNLLQHADDDPVTIRIRIIYIVITYAFFWPRSKMAQQKKL